MILLKVRGRKLILLLVLSILSSLSWQNVSSQVVIGNSGPINKGSLLDLKENNNLGANASRGLLLPRVALESPTLMTPILDDDALGEGGKREHVGLVVYNMHENYRVQLCKGVHVWTPEFHWVRIPEPCCFQLKTLRIENAGLSFLEGEEAIFNAVIMDPIGLEDSNIEYEWFLNDVSLSRRSKSSSIKLTVGVADSGKQLSVRAYNKCSEVESEPRMLTVTSRCVPIEQISISNSLNNSDFRFASGKTVSFIPSLNPTDASNPQCKWEFGSVVSYDEIFTHQVTNSGTLKLTVSNDCSSVSKEVAIEVFQCPTDESVKYTMSPTGWNQPQYTFTITELAGYTKEQLTDLGITVQWYKKQIKWPDITDTQFYPIAGANDPTFVFVAGSYLSSEMDVCNIGVKVFGDAAIIESIMNCPVNNGNSYYNITAKIGDNGEVWAIPKFSQTSTPSW